MNIHERTKKILEELNKDIYEKEEVIALTFLSAIAGESIFLLGAPGVAKSLIARRLKFAFENGKSFEYLMNRFSTPDEIFGPVSITKLKEDKYERLTDKYLPTSNVIFLDEIWKAGPSIQNALLTILNEKIYRNGDKEEKVDIRAILSASNELPEQNQGLEALWDRFLIRYLVGGIENIQSFNEMITKRLNGYDDNIDKELKIKDEEYIKWTEEIGAIQIPNEVLNVINVIRRYLDDIRDEKEQIYVSDRRWRKIVRILRTSAFLNNRKQVDLMDTFLIAHCIWNKPEQFENVKEIVAKSIKEHGYSLEIKSNSIKRAIKEFEQEVKVETVFHKMVFVPEKELINSEYYKIIGIEKYYYSFNLIQKNEFEKLTKTDFTQVSLYHNSNGRKQNRTAKKSENDLQIVIQVSQSYQQKDETFNFKTIEVEKEQETTKKPNHRLVKEWNKLVNQIKSDIGREISKAENYRKTHLNHLQTNLFVDKRLSQFVEGNITEAINDLQKLELQVEKIKHSYETIK